MVGFLQQRTPLRAVVGVFIERASRLVRTALGASPSERSEDGFQRAEEEGHLALAVLTVEANWNAGFVFGKIGELVVG